MGWCFGGGWALQGALELPEWIGAAEMYYERLELERRRLGRLEVPLLGLFGQEDQGIPVHQVRLMDSILRQLSKDATILAYPGAAHGFSRTPPARRTRRSRRKTRGAAPSPSSTGTCGSVRPLD